MFRRYRLLIPDNGSNPASATPQAGDGGANPQPQAGDPQPTPQAGSGKTPEDYERILADLRKENAGHRTKLKKFEDDEAARTQAQMSEQEKLQKQYNDLQSQHNEITLQLREERSINTLERIGRSLGITDAIALEDAVNLALGKLEHDDQGKPTNADDVMKQLVKSRPWLTSGKAQASAGGATNPSRAQSNASGELSWEVITKMTQDQYNTRRDEIQRWMRTAPMKQY